MSFKEANAHSDAIVVLTYHNRQQHSNEPGLKDDSEILLKISDDPTNAAKGQYDPVENELGQPLSLEIHDRAAAVDESVVL